MEPINIFSDANGHKVLVDLGKLEHAKETPSGNTEIHFTSGSNVVIKMTLPDLFKLMTD